MSRFFICILGVFLVTACGSPTPTPSEPVVFPTVTEAASPAAMTTPTSAPSATATLVSPTPTATATPVPSPTSTPLPPTTTPTATPWATATPTPLPSDLWLGVQDLRVHPDGDAFYSGDLISFQISAHHGHDWSSFSVPDVDLEIWLDTPSSGELIAKDRIAFYGGRDGEVWLEWVWNTAGLTGTHTLTAVLDPQDDIQIGDENPDNNTITYTIDLRPRDEVPTVWSNAQWVEKSNTCCIFHYISGTAAERDIEAVMASADEAITFVGEQLDEEMQHAQLDVYLIDRVLGHGGFAGEQIIISYLDRFYAGGGLALVFRHEATHVLDRRFADTRTALLSEGLAVYVAGGHYREEQLDQSEAALLALDRYIPLSELADDFYHSQHEIGYLEAAGFVSFLIDRFGWDAFKAFYGDIQHDDAGQPAMIDAALQEHFGLTLSQAESDWLAMLKALTTPRAQLTDLRLTIDFYDTVRRYQQAWDPSAYFLMAWLPSVEEAERQGVTADMMRHPTGLVNLTLETMLITVDRALDEGSYAQAEALLEVINKALAADGDLAADPLVDQYRALVEATVAAGYEVQRIDLDLAEDAARVWATPKHGIEQVELIFALVAGKWHMTSWGN